MNETNKFQIALVVMLFIGGLLMLTLTTLSIRAEISVEQNLVEMRRIINSQK